MDNQDHPLSTSFARIFYSAAEKQNNSCGAGVALRGNLVLTCAHVIIDALGWNNKAEMPDQIVRLDFPISEHARKQFSARVIFWDPRLEDPNSGEFTGNDLAGLEIVELLPDEIAQVSLKIIHDFWEHPASAFGFKAMSRVSDFGGWTKNTLLKPGVNGWVQMESDSKKGDYIEVGFSGTPVWDEKEKSCVGIIVAVKGGENKRISYMIPTSKIAKLWKDLPIEAPQKTTKSLRESSLLFPYCVDRGQQKNDLEKLWKMNALQFPHPMVAILHGDSEQSHDTFVDRAFEEFIPALCKAKPAAKERLDWPVYLKSTKDLEAELTQQMSEIFLRREGTREEVQDNIAKFKLPVVIYMEMQAEEWKGSKKEALKAVLEFWNNWPPLIAGQHLLIFLCISHKTPKSSWMHQFKHKQIMDRMAGCLSYHYPNIHLHAFSELLDVHEIDARNWARTAAQEFGRDVNLLFSEISKIFKDGKPKPMSPLGQDLRRILISSSGD